MNARDLATRSVTEPDQAFIDAISEDDPIAVGVVSILDPRTDPSVAVALFTSTIQHHVKSEWTLQLALTAFEYQEAISDELLEAVGQVLRDRPQDVTIREGDLERVIALTDSVELATTYRASILRWIAFHHVEVAREVSRRLVEDPGASYDELLQRAIIILGRDPGESSRQALARYAHENLARSNPQQPRLGTEEAMFVLGRLRGISDQDIDQVSELLARLAETGVPPGSSLDNLLKQLEMKAIKRVLTALQAASQTWLAGHLLPAIIRVRPAEIAESAGEEWWPPQCIRTIVDTSWKAFDDRLYARALPKLFLTADEEGRSRAAEHVADRCEDTDSPSPGLMPRVGARALMNLALQGQIATDDPALLRSLAALRDEELADEPRRLRWRSEPRARRLGHILAQVNAAILISVIEETVDEFPETVAALISGTTEELVEPHLEQLVDVLLGHDQPLGALSRLSAEARHRLLQSWRDNQDMSAIRALAGTDQVEEAQSTVGEAILAYGRHSHGDRAELLREFLPASDRAIVLKTIIADRALPHQDKPETADVELALDMIGEDLDRGLDPGEVLDVIGRVCQEARQPDLRKRAYAALGRAKPAEALISLLLERREHEPRAVKAIVQETLQEIAEKLETTASAPESADRAEAASQLARFDLARAAIHARDLLTADEATDRLAGARIIAEAGGREDVPRLREAAEAEPHAEVQAELRRTIRRLEIGDSAAAHERIGELAGVHSEGWLRLNPDELYGPWVKPLVRGLDRIARAESEGDYGTAIDQLDEVAHALLFRAVEKAGATISISASNRAKAATNDLDYGTVLAWQQLNQNWEWVHYFGSLHGLRTEHIAGRGTVRAPPERSPDDMTTAYSFFKLGGGPCLALITPGNLA